MSFWRSRFSFAVTEDFSNFCQTGLLDTCSTSSKLSFVSTLLKVWMFPAVRHSLETLTLQRRSRNTNRLMLWAHTRVRGQRLKKYTSPISELIASLREDVTSCSACQTIQYNYLFCTWDARRLFPNKNQNVFLHARASAAGEAFNDNATSGERRKGKVSVPANKHAAAIFCSFKIRYLGQGVRSFLAGLSRESCFCELRLQSEINEKPFDFPSKEKAWGGVGGSDCELCWGECGIPATGRVKKKKTWIKQNFPRYYEAVRETISAACHLSWG